MSKEIILKNINKTYSRWNELMPVLCDIDFRIKKQEFIAIVGYSGCGKTTLLKIIGGLLEPSSGEIFIEHESPKVALKQHRLGFIFQESSLLPWRTVYNNIKLSSEISGINENRKMIEGLIDLVGLTEYKNLFPSELSGGMKARVAVARALLIEPAILLMDEPFSHLDEITRQTMNDLLLKLWSRYRATAIFVTHNIAEAVFLADKVIVLSKLPAKIKGVVDIELPRPREENLRLETRFLNKVKEVRDLLIE